MIKPLNEFGGWLTLLIVFLSTILISNHANADINLSQKISMSDGINIALPDDWVQISKEAIDQAKAKLEKIDPKAASAFDFSYAFQPKYFTRTFTYPYILVKISNSGRASEAQFTKMKNFKTLYEKGLESAKSDLSGVVSSIKEGEVYYDSDHHILWSNTTVNAPLVGTIKSLTAVILTERGTINVMQYAKEADFNDFLPLFQRIPKQMVLPEGLKYKPRATDSISFLSGIDLKQTLYAAIRGAIIGGIIGLIITWIRKRKQ